jgi:hypothetical protein
MTKNNQIAASVGQGKPDFDPARCYDYEFGVYADELAQVRTKAKLAQATSTVTPFRNLHNQDLAP